jgi:hypothetical protein
MTAMRELTMIIDSTIETLLDAHEFTLMQLESTPSGAYAGFALASVGRQRPAWTIGLNLLPAGTAEVRLADGPDGSARVSLCVRLSPDDNVTPAQAIGLAVSFLGFAQQLGLD